MTFLMIMVMNVHVKLVPTVMTTMMTATKVLNRKFLEQARNAWDTLAHDSTTRVPGAV